MSMITLPRYERPADLVRWLVRAGVLSAVVCALYVVLVQFSGAKECHDGAFSAAFSRAFDVRHCEFVVRRFGSEIGRIPLPAG
jgi:hypothetical protein